MKVLNFGAMNLDYVYQVDHLVLAGETISSASMQLSAGGKGLNQSVALANAGVDVYHAGCMGQGGEMLKKLLADHGVNVDNIYDVDAMQGNAMIQVNKEGQNSIILFGGSNQAVTEEQIENVISQFDAGDYIILQNEINLLPQIVDRAYAQGMKIVLNPSPYDEKLNAVDFGKISWLLINEVEAEQMTGSSDPKEAWEILHERYPHLSAVITQGSAGSVTYQQIDGKVEVTEQNAFKVKAIDTTAAGDTFTGFFIRGLIDGKPMQETMKIASAASAIAVTRPGAAPSVPMIDEVLEWLKG